MTCMNQLIFKKCVLGLLLGLLFSSMVQAQVAVKDFYSHWEDAPITTTTTYKAGTYNGLSEDPPDKTTYTYTWGEGPENNLVLDALTTLAAPSAPYARIKLADNIIINRVFDDNHNHKGTVDNPTGTVDFIWAQPVTGNYNYKPGYLDSMEEVLRSAVINRGTDNVFDNSGDGGNNIERIDFIFPDGLTVKDPAKQGFTVMERGGNDQFKIAAITSLSGGAPSSFGTLTPSGSWGGTGADVSLQIDTDTLKDPTSGPLFDANGQKLLPYRNTVTGQTLRGMFFSLEDLEVSAGDTVYGYSLVSSDEGTACLNNSDDTSCDTSAGSGLDLVAGGSFFETADFGDAPASYGDALHSTSGPLNVYLGTALDGEPDSDAGTQLGDDAGAGADGDDDDGNDDEGAVSSFPTLDAVAGQTYTVSVDAVNTSGSGASLVGYLDFNGDGDFSDAGEQSVIMQVPASGSYPVVFTVPTDVVAGTTYARFRIGSAQTEVESATGNAENGEVEDYQVTIEAATLPDYGDAPESYGAAQVIASGSVYLGSEAPDADAGNWHDGTDDSENATDDDTNDTPSAFTAGSGEEDSVVFGPLDFTMAGDTFSQDVSVTNDSAAPAFVRAWIDFDRNGTFDADEVSDEVTVPANAGATAANLTFNIPANNNGYNGINPGPSFARVIVSDAPGISLSGGGVGEVEDLRVNIADVDVCTFAPGETFSAFDFTNIRAGDGVTNDSNPTSAEALFKNAAVAPDGTPLDVRVTVNATSGVIGRFGNGLAKANNPNPASEVYLSITGDANQERITEVTLEFLLANTNQPYTVSGQFATGDIDKKVTEENNQVTKRRVEALLLDIASFDGYVLDTSTTIRDPYVEGDYTVFEGTGDRDDQADSFVSYAFSEQTSIDLIVRATQIVGTGTAGFGFNGRIASQKIPSRSCSSIPPLADYGDAPESYGYAQHAVPQTPALYLGAVAPDEEEQSLNAANGGADGTGDDLNETDDEDAFDTLPALSTDSSTYTLDVPLTNPSSAATLYGWVDFDRDGRFSASEAATANVAAGASTATLEWSSANGNAPAGLSEGTTFARLRLTADTLIDDAGTANADERASGAATDGEVEDYTLAVTAPGYGPPLTCDAGFYIVIGSGSSVDTYQSQLYRVDRSQSPFGFITVGPSTTVAGGYPENFQLNALAYNPLDNYIYAFVTKSGGTSAYQRGTIVRIDRNGDVQPIGKAATIENYVPIAATFSRDGTYLVGNGNRIVSIDITQSPPTVLNDINVSGVNFTDLVVDPTDPNAERVYFVDQSGTQDRVRFANFTTGVLEGSLPNPTGTNINAGSQFADSLGTLYFRSNSDNKLYRINMDESDTVNYGRATELVQAPAGGSHDGASCAFDVAMEKTVSVTEAQPGDTVTYTYRISNPRSLPVSGLSFDDVVDGGRTFVDGTLSVTRTSYETGTTSSYSVSANSVWRRQIRLPSAISLFPELSVVEITVDVLH